MCNNERPIISRYHLLIIGRFFHFINHDAYVRGRRGVLEAAALRPLAERTFRFAPLHVARCRGPDRAAQPPPGGDAFRNAFILVHMTANRAATGPKPLVTRGLGA